MPTTPVNRDIPFGLPASPANPNDANIAFGVGLTAPGAILEIGEMGEGAGLTAVVFTSVSLPVIAFWQGESLGTRGRQLKDRRLYDELNGVQNPFSLGLAFSSYLLASWPAGYTQTGSYHHFYSGNYGTPVKTSVAEALVLPAFVLAEIFGGDEVAVPVYSGQAGVLGGAAGETLGIILGFTFPGLTVALASGEAQTVAVTNDKQLSVGLGHGEGFAVDVKIESTVTTAGQGESVSLSLDVYDLVAIRGDQGETLTTDLSTRAAIQIALGQGESFSPAVESHPTSYLGLNLGDGQAWSVPYVQIYPASYFAMAWATGESLAAFALVTRVALPPALSVGESFALATLEMPIRPGIEISLSAVQAFTTSLSAAQNLGAIDFPSGSSLTVVAMDELPPYRFATGESMTVAMGVITNLPVAFSTGESIASSLDTRPPAFMSASLFTGGDGLTIDVEVQYRATLHIAFAHGVYITATEQTSTTTYDLADPILYVDTLDWLTDMNAFEFIEMGPSFQYNKGAGIVVTVDLQCRPAFTIGFATGESWALEANARYLAVDLTAPTAAIYPSEFFYVEPKIDLCYPNVFPDADAMEVELDFTDDSCYADYMFAGQTMALSLSACHQMTGGGVTVGESFAFDLDLTQPWKVNFAVGTRMDFYLFTDVKLQSTLGTGESLKATFEETSINFVTGESVVATLHTTYDVEFLERGCLDNEYRYVKPDGFEDVDKFNPVAVELEPFAHDIKARCF